MNGTDYGEPYTPSDVAVDAEARSASGQREPLLMQVVKVDFEQVKALATEGWFEREEVGFGGAFKRLWTSIDKKAKKYSAELKSQVFLLVDGSAFFLEEEVKAFARAGDAIRREAGFREVWFVGSTPNSTMHIA